MGYEHWYGDTVSFPGGPRWPFEVYALSPLESELLRSLEALVEEAEDKRVLLNIYREADGYSPLGETGVSISAKALIARLKGLTSGI